MADGVVRVVPGRHTRRIELESLRRVSLAAMIMLVVQYGLGTILNLYIAIPASDAHAGVMQEIVNGPAMLTLHALLGLAPIGAALLLLIRAVRLEDRVIAVLARRA
jgi:zona occludens toxin (predicted ATPase)